MEDNRASTSSNGRNRRRTTLVLLLAVGTLTVAGAAGTVLWGRGDAATAHPALSGPQSQVTGPAGSAATAGAADAQSTGAGVNAGQQPAGQGKSPDPQAGNPGNPGNPGKAGKLPPVDEVPMPLPIIPQGLPKPPFPKPPIKPLVFKQP